MSFAGLKKQFNKANQYMSEKMGGAKGTELDIEFIEMERKIDVLGKLVEDLINKTNEFLQPNPATRAKMASRNAMMKIRGQENSKVLYTQPEGTLGEHMQKHGEEIGDISVFGLCLVEAGESFKHLAEIKYNLEDNVKQNFLDPLTQLQNKDLKEVNHHRKKLSGRRLDFDCKRRKKEKGAAGGSHITEEELRIAEDKFAESKDLAERSMHNVLENEVEYISQLQAFIEAEVDYHRQALSTLQSLLEQLNDKRSEAASRPRSEHIPKRVGSVRRSESPNPFGDNHDSYDHHGNSSGSYSFNNHQFPNAPSNHHAPVPTKPSGKQQVRALYDFEPENDGELEFREGQIIDIISQIDENWYEGKFNGSEVGLFPVNYVEKI